jgi:predicted nucleic acid-binding protein
LAQQALVIDASVGVKWFSAEGEASVSQARSILKAHAGGDIKIVVPDLFFYEILNALVHKKTIPTSMVEESIALLFALGLAVYSPSEAFFRSAVQLARKHGITEYDACYVAAAIGSHCPLVTANPRHHKKDFGCRVIGIEDWKLPL